MGRKPFILTACAFFLCFSGCGERASENKAPSAKTVNAPTPIPTASIPKDGNYDGAGEVTKINMELGSVELKHEEIKDLMPPMQMEFFVKDKALLKDLKVGERVRFVIEYKHPQEIITSITKTP